MPLTEEQDAVTVGNPSSGRITQARKARLRLLVLLLLAVIGIPAWRLWQAVQQEQRNNLLIIAIRRNDLQTVTLLLNQGADPNTRDKDDEQGDGKIDLRRVLAHLFANKRKEASASETALPALIVAIWPGMTSKKVDANPAILKALLDHGAAPSIGAVIEGGAVRFLTDPLASAAQQNDLGALRILLDHGADPNRGACAGLAVFFSASYGNAEMLRCLFAHGARIHDVGHPSSLEAAISIDKTETAGILLSQGADVNVKGDGGREFLQAAQWSNDQKLVRLLKQHGARN